MQAGSSHSGCRYQSASGIYFQLRMPEVAEWALEVQQKAGEQGSGTPETAGDGGPLLQCGDIKRVRWEPPGRQIQGQVMPPLPKQRKNEIKCASHFASQVTLYSGKSSNLI